jgi:MoxR-like ATPase
MDASLIEELAGSTEAMLSELERAVVGKREVLELLLMAFLADGHVLIDDVPGLAKTLMARSFAVVTGLTFGRIQFTPDLLPSDITGSSIYNQREADFEFRPGPVFTNLLLADEINRAPAKTQSALLEAMQERRVTIDGQTNQLPEPFLVIATQNPIEFEGTYPLPEAQLDRFLLRIAVGYPSEEDEWTILRRRIERQGDEVSLHRVVELEEISRLKRAVEQVHLSESAGRYIVALVAATRSSPRAQVGSSPRGSLAILKLARVKALLAGRDFVTPDDVKAVALPALGHRITLRPEYWVQQVRGDDIVQECIERVATPAADQLRAT